MPVVRCSLLWPRSKYSLCDWPIAVQGNAACLKDDSGKLPSPRNTNDIFHPQILKNSHISSRHIHRLSICKAFDSSRSNSSGFQRDCDIETKRFQEYLSTSIHVVWQKLVATTLFPFPCPGIFLLHPAVKNAVGQ